MLSIMNDYGMNMEATGSLTLVTWVMQQSIWSLSKLKNVSLLWTFSNAVLKSRKSFAYSAADCAYCALWKIRARACCKLFINARCICWSAADGNCVGATVGLLSTFQCWPGILWRISECVNVRTYILNTPPQHLQHPSRSRKKCLIATCDRPPGVRTKKIKSNFLWVLVKTASGSTLLDRNAIKSRTTIELDMSIRI